MTYLLEADDVLVICLLCENGSYKIMSFKFTYPSRLAWRNVALIYGITCCVIALLIVVSFLGGYSLKSLLRHPASSAQISPLVGAIFYLGVLLWMAGAAICAFCYLFLRTQQQPKSSFFLYSTVVTFMLVLDKLFELNDYVFPRYLGIGEGRAYILYAFGLMLYFFTFRHTILRTNLTPLVVAFTIWALATFIDLSYLILPFYYPRWVYLAKDILKLLGIVGWTSYFVMAGMDAIRSTNVSESHEFQNV